MRPVDRFETYARLLAILVPMLLIAACAAGVPPVFPTASPALSPLFTPGSSPANQPTSSERPPATPAGVATASPLTLSPFPTFSPATPAPDKGKIVGTVQNASGPLPPGTQVYTAQFTWDPNRTGGVYLLDPQVPGGPVAPSGEFQISDLVPGDYVLIVGTRPEKGGAILGQDGQARVITVKGGEVINLPRQVLPIK